MFNAVAAVLATRCQGHTCRLRKSLQGKRRCNPTHRCFERHPGLGVAEAMAARCLVTKMSTQTLAHSIRWERGAIGSAKERGGEPQQIAPRKAGSAPQEWQHVG